jgi:hypothetical protein
MVFLGSGIPGLAGLRRKLKMNVHNVMDGFILDSHGRIPYSPNPKKKVSIT